MPPIVLTAGIHNLRIGESIRIPADYRVKIIKIDGGRVSLLVLPPEGAETPALTPAAIPGKMT